MNDIFGSDIKLGADGDVVIAANGELVLTDDIDTLCQDVRLRLMTLLGSLFYDENYGSNLPLFIKDDEADNGAIEAEIVRTIEKDPRIEPYSVSAKVIKQEPDGITVSASWQCKGEDTVLNQVITIDKSLWEQAI